MILSERPDHPGSRQGEVNLDSQPFAVIIINDIESPEAAAIRQNAWTK